MPPQIGDQWGSLTSKCVRLEGPTYLDLPPSNMGQVPKKVLSKEAPLTRHFSDKDWQGKAAGRNQQSFLPLKTLSFQGLASKPTWFPWYFLLAPNSMTSFRHETKLLTMFLTMYLEQLSFTLCFSTSQIVSQTGLGKPTCTKSALLLNIDQKGGGQTHVQQFCCKFCMILKAFLAT